MASAISSAADPAADPVGARAERATAPARRAFAARHVALAVAVFLVLAGNAALRDSLRASEVGTPWLVMLASTVMLAAVYNLLLQCVALPWVFKPVATALLVIAALASWFMDEYGVLIDRDMIRNVVQTDVGEATDLVSWGGCVHVALLAVVPAIILFRLRLAYGPWRRELWRRPLLALGGLALGLLLTWPAYKQMSFIVREHSQVKLQVNPVSPLGAVVEYWARLAPPRALQPLGLDAVRPTGPAGGSGHPRLFVFVLGETATAGHFSLNGYERQTNPELEARDVVNFAQVQSCGTSTAESLPCIFSALPRVDFDADEARHDENLLDVLQRAGIELLWRDNNSGCKQICDRIPFEEFDGKRRKSTGEPLSGFDEDLLLGLQQVVDAAEGDLFVVLHQRGSHGPAYFESSPPEFKAFLPECARTDLQACSQEEIVNAYDNTILYTDHFLGLVIDFLEANSLERQTAMLYVSDHGESLGENGVYLHGFPFWMAPEEQTHVPMVFWASPDFFAGTGLDPLSLCAASAAQYSHDNLFHSLLGLFDVQTSVYDPALDLFAPHRLR